MASESKAHTGFARELSLADGIAVVVGTVIGSGVFLVPGSIAKHLTSLGPVLLIWLVGAVLSLCGGLALGELGAMLPEAGGLYVYLRRAYGRPLAFLYGWGLLTMIHTGSIATLAAAFRLYLAQMIPLSAVEQKAAGIACVILLTFFNCRGLRMGKFVQNLSTLSKVGGLGLMIALLFWSSRGHFPTSTAQTAAAASFPDEGWVKWGVALVAVLWAFEGWHVASFIAAEFKNTQRDLPRALLYGTLIIAAIYILANVSYYMVLTPAQVASSDAVAAYAVQHSYGVFGRNCISLLIMISIFGAMNGMILTGPRVYYAMAKDGIFLESFGSLNPRVHAPIFGLVVQGIWASLLTVLGTFTQLFTYVIFTAWIFYALAVAGVAVLRVREPNLKRDFRAPALPLLVGGFVLAALGMSVSTIVNDPKHAMIGLGLILSGLPVYAIARWSKGRTPSGIPGAEG